MMNMTVYEDSDPANLAIEAGKNYGLPANQQGQLKVAIESQILQRVKLRIPIDMSGNGTSLPRSPSPPTRRRAALSHCLRGTQGLGSSCWSCSKVTMLSLL